MKKRFLALLCALMLLALPVLAVPAPEEYFYVLDEADVLSTETEDYIIYNSQRLEEKCGAQIVVVAVNDTDGMAIDDYAHKLYNNWKIGSADKDYGILMLMAIDDDNYYCEPGEGVSRRMASGTIKLLLDDYLEPSFADKNYDAGARKIYDALFGEMVDICGVSLAPAKVPASGTSASTQTAPAKANTRFETTPAKSRGGIDPTVILFIVVLVIVLVVLTTSRSRARRRRTPPPPPMGVPTPPPVVKPVVRPIIKPIIRVGPKPGPAPRPPQPPVNPFGGAAHKPFTPPKPITPARPSRPSVGKITRPTGGISFGGGRTSRPSGGASRTSRPSASSFSRGSRIGGGGSSRGGGAGRGR